MKYPKISISFFSVVLIFSSVVFAQDRQRVVQTEKKPVSKIDSKPINPPPSRTYVKKTSSSRPVLTNEVRVVKRDTPTEPALSNSSTKVLVSSEPNLSMEAYGSVMRSVMMSSITNKLGLRYIYGSSGPNSYDCSGFVWKVFQDAGFDFSRTSARNYWKTFEPATGDDRYKFGTLVFFNKLGHMGIVVDENGFYHASSSNGVTYSPFKGYWEKRIVGFRRVPVNLY
ncbi:MAG: C40 family peptidase [Pyrinomonadaceae bacterium]